MAIGVSIPTISQWEHGKTDPSGERLKKLAEYFDVDELMILGKMQSKGESTEAETIIQHVLDRLTEMPTSPQIKIVSGIMGKMTDSQQNQVVAVVRALFQNHPEILDERKEER